MAEITEEKAHELKAHFVELGARVGKDAGSRAGEAALQDADSSGVVREAEVKTNSSTFV